MIQRTLVWLLVLAMAWGCGPNGDSDNGDEYADDDDTYPADRQEALQREIDNLIEAGHAAEPEPVLSSDEHAERDVRAHRRRVADDMRAGAAQAVAPLAVAAAFFAPGGAVDLLLTVMPAGRLSQKAVDLAQQGLKARKKSARARKLTRLNDEFQGAIDPASREFLHRFSRLTDAERRALATVMDRTGSPKVVTRLLGLQEDHGVDLEWIASKLGRRHMDADMVERFTYDAGVIEDITLHDSNMSWNTLKRVVEGTPVDDRSRAVLAGKARGLMGERAAREIMHSPAFLRRYIKDADDKLASGQGLTYEAGRRYGDTNRSLDIVAFTDSREAVFVEVKTWSSQTWQIPNQTDKIFAQLTRHDQGIETIVREGKESRTVAGKILMIEEDGYMKGMSREKREIFENLLEKKGWKLEKMPSSDIPSFADLIDSLR